MKIKYIRIALFIVSSWASLATADNNHILLAQKLTDSSPSKSHKGSIYFHYDNEDLITIINTLAAEKQINIVLPMGTNEIKSKVTLHIEKALTLEEAWDILQTILDVSGYSLLPHGSMYMIVKNHKLMAKEIASLYIATPIDKIPNTDEHIRYIYYLKNPNKDVITQTLKEILSDTATYALDVSTNALLITDKANNIRSAMHIIKALDGQTAFSEDVDIVSLRYASASIVAKLFTDNILKLPTEATRFNLKSQEKSEDTFFSSHMKIIPDIRTNKLIIAGKKQDIERVRDFIIKYIDVELGTGKSILHVYELLYLDAAQFAPILTAIVQSQQEHGVDQATGGEAAKGLDRFFEGVLIKPAVARGDELQSSNNKLIIAAKTEDWVYIKKLIEELDTPQRQVIIEVLVADLTVSDIRQLGSITRNPQNLALKPGVSEQSAELNGIILDNPPNSTLAADLLNQTALTTPTSPLLNTSAGAMGEPGSTVISLNDPSGRTWSVLQLLQKFGHTKILSHPHIIANNNQKAFISIGEQRFLPDEATATSGGQIITFKKINAYLTVTIIPRISSTDNVNLEVAIDISEFIAGGGNQRVTRVVKTNATVHSNDILALGGLIKTNEADSLQAVPILSKIPILGWLFKRKRKGSEKTNLTVFISPTVILPRLRGGVNDYTRDYVELSKNYANEAQLFDGLRDPITRFFFKSRLDAEAENELDIFLKDHIDPKSEQIAASATPVPPAPVVVAQIETPKLSEEVVSLSTPESVERGPILTENSLPDQPITPESMLAVIDTKGCENQIELAPSADSIALAAQAVPTPPIKNNREKRLRELL